MFSTGALANPTLYVGNDVKIPMRTNASVSGDNIITSIAINEPVAFIKGEGGWSNIEYKGQQGWMISRYLSNSEPQNHKAADLVRRIGGLNRKIDRLNQENRNLKDEFKKNKKGLVQQEKQTHLLGLQEIQLNTNKMELNKLRDEALTMNNSNTALLDQITTLQSNQKTLYGLDFLTIVSAITLFLGLIVGFFGGRSSSNKNKTMYTI